MTKMFCFQCEQTIGGKVCSSAGACGKTADVSNGQDDIISSLVSLAKVTGGSSPGEAADELLLKGLFMTVTNVNFSTEDTDVMLKEIKNEINKHGDMPIASGFWLWEGDEDVVSLRSTLLMGIKGMAAYAWHAYVLGKKDEQVMNWFYKGLHEMTVEHTAEEWLEILLDFGNINLRCMELLDEANTSMYGHPVPVKVTMEVEKGPFIVVSGHDLHDLKQLLEQTENKGVNIYTHGEMLPAHGYPKLKEYKHLKGNFGTAWQNQRKEFDNVPAAFLFTTNCLMPPAKSYMDRVFTTAMVGFPGLVHIPEKDGRKDFTPVIEKAIALGGYSENRLFHGINGGSELMTGFGHNTVLGAADKVVELVNEKKISHFFLVGGCDGAKTGRNYYTEFVEKSPKDSMILTLACGKYRFNDLDLGSIEGLPRIMDMGQCNDAYSAIKVASALSGVFNCSVNELPLTLVLSWYEQKAVCILLTLLALGIRNIYIGPTLPAFLSSNVLNLLVEKFNLSPISSAEEDLKKILK